MRLERGTATVDMRQGHVRLVAVSDTHSQPHPLIDQHLARLAPAAILHGGDIGDLAVLDGLAARAPVHAVRGNIDTRATTVPDVMTIEVMDGDTLRLRILLTHIALAGPRIRADAGKLVREAQATLLVCGHSHVPFMGQERGVTVFNPGSIGPRRFSLPICFGVIEIDQRRVKLAHVDCETGATWLPP